MSSRLNVLVISDLFPNYLRPARGIFVERQVFHLQKYANNVVIVPNRIFPHLEFVSRGLKNKNLVTELSHWWSDVKQTPFSAEWSGITTYYPTYTSLPRQFFSGTWGFFAYPFLRPLLLKLHAENKFDIIHAHYASPCGVIGLLAKRWMNVPVVISVHGADVTYTAKQVPIGLKAIQWAFKRADAILANSHWTRNQVIQCGGDAGKTHIVRLGGDLQTPAINSKNGNQTGQGVTLLSVGYLTPTKGQEYVIRAMHRLIQEGYALNYVIVGDGPEEEKLRTLAKELGVDSYVKFEGYKIHNEVWPYFADCDIFVLPSWIEGFGVVYVEALSFGKPVIGCEGTGGPDDLRQLGNCILQVKPQDVDSLYQAMKALIDQPELREEMGKIGRDIVNRYFTWDQTARDTLSIYNTLL